MTVWEAVFLGVLQGLTEFLPVSSSGHLVLAQRIFGIQGGVVLFDVTVHLGTLLAVGICFWRDLWALVKKPLCRETGMLIVATVPAVAVALIFGDLIEEAFGGTYLGWGFLITAVILLPAGRAKSIPDQKIGYKAAVIMGLAQGLAVLPGISRSGATIGGGSFAGADRGEAARFSFLMSFPVILGAAAYQFTKLGAVTQSVGALPLALGFAFAALAGVISVKFMLGVIRKARFWPFSVYLFLLGGFVLLNQYVLNLF